MQHTLELQLRQQQVGQCNAGEQELLILTFCPVILVAVPCVLCFVLHTLSSSQVLSGSVLPDGIVVPKVEHARDLEWVENEIISHVGVDCSKAIILIALVESMKGLVSGSGVRRTTRGSVGALTARGPVSC